VPFVIRVRACPAAAVARVDEDVELNDVTLSPLVLGATDELVAAS
jgi:hypothetical protein